MQRRAAWWWMAALALGMGGLAIGGFRQPDALAQGRTARPAPQHDLDDDPHLEKKLVPILTVGSNLNVGAAQVTGPAERVREVKAVAQLETDYKDWARIKVLVPVSTEDVIRRIERVPGVSVSALADVRLSD